MVFVHPMWYEGLFVWVLYFLPFFILLGIAVYSAFRMAFAHDYDVEKKYTLLFFVCGILCVAMVPICEGVGGYLWHEQYEVPSVDEKVITVESWQVKPNTVHTENGMMVIDNADQLMLITDTGEGFVNEENFLFQKFDTRDILNTLKPGGKYKIEYYGWREGYNSGFPNILSVKEVIDESNSSNVSLGDYFGTKLSLN